LLDDLENVLLRHLARLPFHELLRQRAHDGELLFPGHFVDDALGLPPPFDENLADFSVELRAAARQGTAIPVDHVDHRQKQRIDR
jgi:hypothetical protein